MFNVVTKVRRFTRENRQSKSRTPQYITTALPHAPDLLRIDPYPIEKELGYCGGLDMNTFQSLLPFQHEQIAKEVRDGDERHTVLHLYWNLNKIDFSPDALLRKIIKADLGGISALVSSVYFANTEDVYLYHVYDDRGADLVAESKETLRPLYHNFNQWILDYDRKKLKYCLGNDHTSP